MLDSAFERYALTLGQDWGERMNLIHVIRRYVEAEVRVAVRQHESQHHT